MLAIIIGVPLTAVLVSYENLLAVSIIGVVESVMKLVAAWLLSGSAQGLLQYSKYLLCIQILLILIRGAYVYIRYRFVFVGMFRNKIEQGILREMISYSAWSTMGSFSGLLSNHGQSILLNRFFGVEANASQGVANQINGQLSAAANNLVAALNPRLAKYSVKSAPENMYSLVFKASKWSFFLVAIFCLPILTNMKIILDIWLKEVPRYAIVFLRLLLLKTMIEQLFRIVAASIMAKGKIKAYQSFSSVLSLVPLITTGLMFYWNYPPWTLYIIFLIYTVFASILILYFAHRELRFPVIRFVNKVVLKTLFITSVITFMDFNYGLLNGIL